MYIALSWIDKHPINVNKPQHSAVIVIGCSREGKSWGRRPNIQQLPCSLLARVRGETPPFTRTRVELLVSVKWSLDVVFRMVIQPNFWLQTALTGIEKTGTGWALWHSWLRHLCHERTGAHGNASGLSLTRGLFQTAGYCGKPLL